MKLMLLRKQRTPENRLNNWSRNLAWLALCLGGWKIFQTSFKEASRCGQVRFWIFYNGFKLNSGSFSFLKISFSKYIPIAQVQVNLFQKLATSGEHVVYQNCSECQKKSNNLCTQHVLQVFWAYSFHEQWTICRHIVGQA